MEDIKANQIRNFCIIAHIDHGKSTLADRFLELTKTVEQRKMKEQYLDQMELERERGITIKLQPVKMVYRPPNSKPQALNSKQIQNSNNQNSKYLEFRTSNLEFASSEYILNLIDTPGHIDFSYEVSRSLKAVEGAVLLVDATQGVQAQTVSNLEMAEELGLVIIPVINKIDSPNARREETRREIIEILGCRQNDILEISAKEGEGVEELLQEIIQRVPSPNMNEVEPHSLRALVFDFEYSSHQGVILHVRIMNGAVKKGDNLFLHQANKSFVAGEVGIFAPFHQSTGSLSTGEIGYLITNVKEAGIAKVGDTLLFKNSQLEPLTGYKDPEPVVWASIYPESQNDFTNLKRSIERLKLSDSAFVFEQEESGVLGRGFRCGFLGMLHLEIITERLKREFNLKLITAMPSVVYSVEDNKGQIKEIYSPALFPEYHDIKRILEPWAKAQIITPFDRLSDVIQILKKHEALMGETKDFSGDRVLINSYLPLREIMSNFFEEIKSATAGYASFNYRIEGEKEADLIRLDVLLNDDLIPAFSKIVRRSDMQREAQNMAEKLKKFIPSALFVIKIQVKALGRILSARSISALKKNVTGNLYGGDITRKMKLWQKQKKGKKKLKKFGKVDVPHDVFLKMIKN